MTDTKSPPANHPKPGFLRRLSLAFGALFRTVSDADYATRIDHLRQPQEAPPTQEKSPEKLPEETPKPAPPVLKAASPDAALQLLGLLQRDARLIDFAMEDLSGYADAQIGAAARVVHEGCRKVLNEHFTIAPVRAENEGSRITLNEGFDAAAVRVTGNVVGKPPFTGSLTHRGWRAAEIRLPQLAENHDAKVITPAEVEL